MNFDKESKSEDFFFFFFFFLGGGGGRERRREEEEDSNQNKKKTQKTIGIRKFFVLMLYIKFQVPGSRLTAEKMLKGHDAGKNQSSMTSIKYAHLQVMTTISGKFDKNPS